MKNLIRSDGPYIFAALVFGVAIIIRHGPTWLSTGAFVFAALLVGIVMGVAGEQRWPRR